MAYHFDSPEREEKRLVLKVDTSHRKVAPQKREPVPLQRAKKKEGFEAADYVDMPGEESPSILKKQTDRAADWASGMFRALTSQQAKLILAMVIVLLIVQAFGGSTTGQATSSIRLAANVERQAKDIELIRANTESAGQDVDDLTKRVEGYRTEIIQQYSSVASELSECAKEKEAALSSAINRTEACNAEKESLRASVEIARSMAQENEENYDACVSQKDSESESLKKAVKNAANVICCMQRVTNPSISYYYVEDDRVRCTDKSDENDKIEQLSC